MEYLGASSTSDASGSGSSIPTSSCGSSSGPGFVACTSSGSGRRRHGKGVAGGDCEGGEGRWCLPADVLDKIFTLLPVQDVIRAGAVCRWWQSVVTSYEARNASRTMPSPLEGDIYFPVFFSDAHKQSCFGFDIANKKWRELPPITFLPPSDDPHPSSSATQLVCSDKGLVCVQKGGQYYVCNPATKSYKLLPPMICCKSDRHRQHTVELHLQVERDGEAYSLVAHCRRVIVGPRALVAGWWMPVIVWPPAGRRRPPLLHDAQNDLDPHPERPMAPQRQHAPAHARAQQHQHALAWARGPGSRLSCYNSRTNSWTLSPYRPFPVGGDVVAGSVLFRGVVYILAHEEAVVNMNLIAYHVERQTWARIGSVHPDDQGCTWKLVVVGDHVMAVTLDSKGFVVSSFKPPAGIDTDEAAAQGHGYEVHHHDLLLEEGSEFLRDCNDEGWACVGYQTSIYIVTLRSLKLAVCHVFKKTWLRLQSGPQHCAVRTHLATPLSCPIEVGLRTPV